MAVQGNKRQASEGKEFVKRIGMFESVPVAVNPTKEELEALLGIELEREIDYTGVDKDGYAKITISFWLKEKQTGDLFNLKMFLVDRPKESQTTPGNFQYINEVGMCTWATNEKDLKAKEWFARRPYRMAVGSEEELHEFLRCWLNLDYGAPDTTLLLDTKRLFKGDYTELRSCIKNFSDTSVCALATVRTVKDESGETKEYQAVYNRKFLPGGFIKYFTGAKGSKVPKMVDSFQKKVTDPEYGCTDHYKLCPLTEYNSEENPLAGDAAIVTEKKESEPGGNGLY